MPSRDEMRVTMSARAVVSAGEPFVGTGVTLHDPDVAMDEISSMAGNIEPVVLRVAASGGDRDDREDLAGREVDHHRRHAAAGAERQNAVVGPHRERRGLGIIAMRDEPEVTAAKIRTMPTDPQRVRRTDAGDPARCPVWPLHQIYSDDATRTACDTGCRTAAIGCLDCKQPLIEAIQREQAPWRERAAALDPQQVKWTLEVGTERARAVARKTLREVRAVMGLVA